MVANSDYTAPDFQHMLVGAVIPNSNGTIVSGSQIIPSFHRPELVNYWASLTPSNNSYWAAATSVGNSSLLTLRRNTIMRPNETDHPYFTGSNPNVTGSAKPWDPVNGPWDVNNDGDGVPDSIWVDLGMPVRSAADGRLYKPLFAVLCLDLDGRLNVNAHGCLAQADTTDYGTVTAGGNALYANGGPGSPSAQISRGQGCGLPEVNLSLLFQGWPAAYGNILTGSGALEGRYGSNQAPGANQVPTTTNQNYLGLNKFYNVPDNYSAGPSAYASPLDFKGSLAIGLDMRGQPLYPTSAGNTSGPLMPDPTVPGSMTNPYVGRITNDPYEMNLSQNAPRGLSSPSATPDNPFGPAELEKLLRPYDKDWSNLPSRLFSLTTAGNFSLVPKRQEVTTDSWDLPCPPPAVPPAVSNSLPDHRRGT